MIGQWRLYRSGRLVNHSQHRSWPRRLQSIAAPKLGERVTLPCQSNGNVTLDIYYPSKSLAVTDHLSKSAVIYLPRGPFLHNEKHAQATLSTLQSILTCPIVQINYRLSKEQQYPTPIHDVLAGYDWVKENLLPKRAITRPGRSEHVGKLGVCGELIGGGLAAMLALTECRFGEPGVVAAAVSNPLVDWISLTASIPTLKSKRGRQRDAEPSVNPDLAELRGLRSQLFRRPDGYFDPFASPILFFRSAGVEVPKAPAATFEDDMHRLSLLEREDTGSDESNEESTSDSQAQRKRKVSRRFPSKALRLQLPAFSISSGEPSPLQRQNDEFVSLLRKSIARQASNASSDFGHKVLLEEEEAEMDGKDRSDSIERASYEEHDGVGLWDDSEEGKLRALKMANWLKTSLA